MKTADSDHTDLTGLQLSRLELLKRRMDVADDGDGIDALIWTASVTALSVDGDGKGVAGCRGGTMEHDQRAAGDHGIHMDAHGCVYLRVFQDPVIQHGPCSHENFFAGLEHEFNSSL